VVRRQCGTRTDDAPAYRVVARRTFIESSGPAGTRSSSSGEISNAEKPGTSIESSLTGGGRTIGNAHRRWRCDVARQFRRRAPAPIRASQVGTEEIYCQKGLARRHKVHLGEIRTAQCGINESLQSSPTCWCRRSADDLHAVVHHAADGGSTCCGAGGRHWCRLGARRPGCCLSLGARRPVGSSGSGRMVVCAGVDGPEGFRPRGSYVVGADIVPAPSPKVVMLRPDVGRYSGRSATIGSPRLLAALARRDGPSVPLPQQRR